MSKKNTENRIFVVSGEKLSLLKNKCNKNKKNSTIFSTSPKSSKTIFDVF